LLALLPFLVEGWDDQLEYSRQCLHNSSGRLSRCDGMLGLRQRFRNFTGGLDK
jgi:hypothetical protein